MATKIIRNTLADQRPYVATIEPLEDFRLPAIEFPYNPEAWTVTPRPRWTAQNRAAAFVDASDWVGNSPKQITFRQLLAAQDFIDNNGGILTVNTDQTRVVEDILLSLEQWATRPTDLTQRPTLLLVTFGVHLYQVHIESLRINRLRVDFQANALTAEIDLTLAENV